MRRSEKTFRNLRKSNQTHALAWGQESAQGSESMRVSESQQKQLDEILHQNEELAKSNAEKDMFFSIIAHDLRNPFTTIIGFSELLANDIRDKEYDTICEYADMILQSSKQAMNLLISLLEWAQFETGRMKFNPEYFELYNLINEAVLLLLPTAEKKSITIREAVYSEVLIYADRCMIGTILRNLISNAIKFTPTGGEIFISLENKQNELIVSVRDTGVGIPKSKIDKLFLLEEKYSTSGTNNEQGTGLGLILCKEFIEKHGGKIWVESEEGKGSNFIFTL